MAKSVSPSLWEETRRPQDRINDIIRRLNVRGRAPWQRLATKSWTHVKGVRTGGGEATVAEATVVIALITTKI
ncbi:hypothetical protein ElyMa_004623100, partial [Elysia marginata]